MSSSAMCTWLGRKSMSAKHPCPPTNTSIPCHQRLASNKVFFFHALLFEPITSLGKSNIWDGLGSRQVIFQLNYTNLKLFHLAVDQKSQRIASMLLWFVHETSSPNRCVLRNWIFSNDSLLDQCSVDHGY